MKEQTTIQVKSITERQDYGALRSYYMYKRVAKRTKALALIMLVSFGLLVINETAFGFWLFKPLGIVGIVIVTAIYSWITIDTRPLENNLHKILNKNQDCILSNDGLSLKWEGVEQTEYTWAKLEYAYENDFHFFIFIEKHFAIVLPKSLMKEKMAKDIHELLDGHLKLINESTGFEYNKI